MQNKLSINYVNLVNFSDNSADINDIALKLVSGFGNYQKGVM